MIESFKDYVSPHIWFTCIPANSLQYVGNLRKSTKYPINSAQCLITVAALKWVKNKSTKQGTHRQLPALKFPFRHIHFLAQRYGSQVGYIFHSLQTKWPTNIVIWCLFLVRNAETHYMVSMNICCENLLTNINRSNFARDVWAHLCMHACICLSFCLSFN